MNNENLCIKILSHWHGEDENSKKIKKVFKENIRKYCDKNNYAYDFSEKRLTDRPVYWDKIKLVSDALKNKNVDWVFFLDADCLILNYEQKLENIISKTKKDMIISQNLNSGAFLIKNTEWSEYFLKKIWYKTKFIGAFGEEMSALKEAYLEDESSDDYIHLIHPKKFSSIYSGRLTEYTCGDFIVHFGGLPINLKAELMESFNKSYDFALNSEKFFSLLNKT